MENLTTTRLTTVLNQPACSVCSEPGSIDIEDPSNNAIISVCTSDDCFDQVMWSGHNEPYEAMLEIEICGDSPTTLKAKEELAFQLEKLEGTNTVRVVEKPGSTRALHLAALVGIVNQKTFASSVHHYLSTVKVPAGLADTTHDQLLAIVTAWCNVFGIDADSCSAALHGPRQ